MFTKSMQTKSVNAIGRKKKRKVKIKTPQQEKSNRKRKCLSLWSKIIRYKAGGLCEKCGKKATEAHHIIARGRSITGGWFDLNNGVALCPNCHKFRGAHSSDFDEQVAFNLWVKGYLARKNISYELLKIQCKSKGKIDMDLTFIYLQQEAKKLGVK